jgi:hypothetical protein
VKRQAMARSKHDREDTIRHYIACPPCRPSLTCLRRNEVGMKWEKSWDAGGSESDHLISKISPISSTIVNHRVHFRNSSLHYLL